VAKRGVDDYALKKRTWHFLAKRADVLFARGRRGAGTQSRESSPYYLPQKRKLGILARHVLAGGKEGRSTVNVDLIGGGASSRSSLCPEGKSLLIKKKKKRGSFCQGEGGEALFSLGVSRRPVFLTLREGEKEGMDHPFRSNAS